MHLCDLLLGLKELSPPNLNLLHIFQNETQASEPILFILSLGADPSQELQDLAKSTIGADKYHQVCDFVLILYFIDYFLGKPLFSGLFSVSFLHLFQKRIFGESGKGFCRPDVGSLRRHCDCPVTGGSAVVPLG